MISAIILTKNEETNIVDCIDSLTFCDEILVIDDNSSDRTRALARDQQAKVFIRDLGKNFSAQRNFGLEKAKGDWVLFVDADERVSEELASEITQAVISQTVQGYYVYRTDYMWGKQLRFGETSQVKLVRLAKKDAGAWRGTVHEVWDIKGAIQTLKNPLMHVPHPSIHEFLQAVNEYSTLRADELHAQGAHASLLTIVAYPKAKFIQNYILRRGFLDGIQGFIMALMMSFHSFLVRGKLYLLNRHESHT